MGTALCGGPAAADFEPLARETTMPNTTPRTATTQSTMAPPKRRLAELAGASGGRSESAAPCIVRMEEPVPTPVPGPSREGNELTGSIGLMPIGRVAMGIGIGGGLTMVL